MNDCYESAANISIVKILHTTNIWFSTEELEDFYSMQSQIKESDLIQTLLRSLYKYNLELSKLVGIWGLIIKQWDEKPESLCGQWWLMPSLSST
jgi:hypothetical protein